MNLKQTLPIKTKLKIKLQKPKFLKEITILYNIIT